MKSAKNTFYMLLKTILIMIIIVLITFSIIKTKKINGIIDSRSIDSLLLFKKDTKSDINNLDNELRNKIKSYRGLYYINSTVKLMNENNKPTYINVFAKSRAISEFFPDIKGSRDIFTKSINNPVIVGGYRYRNNKIGDKIKLVTNDTKTGNLEFTVVGIITNKNYIFPESFSSKKLEDIYENGFIVTDYRNLQLLDLSNNTVSFSFKTLFVSKHKDFESIVNKYGTSYPYYWDFDYGKSSIYSTPFITHELKSFWFIEILILIPIFYLFLIFKNKFKNANFKQAMFTLIETSVITTLISITIMLFNSKIFLFRAFDISWFFIFIPIVLGFIQFIIILVKHKKLTHRDKIMKESASYEKI